MGARKVMALYYYIFLSHLLASSATVVGVPLSGSNECWFEGIVGSLFSMSAIMWTVSVLVLLYSNVAYKKPVQLTTIHHLLCWCIPLLCVLLPLSNSTYAAPSAGIGWCRVVGPDALAWMWASHYGVVYLCYLATLVITVRFFVHINGVDVLALANDTFKVNVRTSDKFKSAMWVVLAYPLVYFICWVPSTVVDVMSVVRPDVALTAELMDFAAGLACLTGFFTSIVFWVTNEYVRDLWLGVVNRAAAASSGHDLSSYRSFNDRAYPCRAIVPAEADCVDAHRGRQRRHPRLTGAQVVQWLRQDGHHGVRNRGRDKRISAGTRHDGGAVRGAVRRTLGRAVGGPPRATRG